MAFQRGWHPDYTQPGIERWHDGTTWTDFVRPAAAQRPSHQLYAGQPTYSDAPMPPQAAGPSHSRRALYGFVAILAVIGALSLWGWVSSSGLFSPASLSSYDCEDLAEEAMSLSEGEFSQLLDVRQPHIVEDHREDYELPTGTDESLVIECEGLGVWSHGTNSPVSLRLTVDADGQAWIRYQDLGFAGPN